MNTIKKAAAVVCVLSLLCSLAGTVPQAYAQENNGNRFYVSEERGSDDGDGSYENPWSSIQRAALRMTAGDTCIIESGTYEGPIEPANSGEAGKPITFQAAPGANVVISGLTKIEPERWEKTDLKSKYTIFKAQDVEMWGTDSNSTRDENQVFFYDPQTSGDIRSGKMMTLARSGNATEMGELFPTNLSKVGLTDHTLRGDEINLMIGSDVNGLVGAQIWYSPRNTKGWSCWTSRITAVDTGSKKIHFHQSTSQSKLTVQSGGRYFIQDAMCLLDQPGEWYYNADETTLYIIPPEDHAGELYVCYKSQRNGFILDGKSNIRIENLHFFGCGVEMDNATTGCVLNRITAEYAQHSISGEDCMGAQCWGSGEREGLGEGGIQILGSGNTLQNSEIAYCSGNGVYVSGEGHTIVNNYIHDVDYIGSYACAIHLINARECLISHNTMKSAGRSLINAATSGFYNCQITYNVMAEGMKLVDDGGALYVSSMDGEGTEIAYNVITDMKKTDEQKFVQGLYLDGLCSNMIVHHNVLKGCNLQMNQPSEYCLFYNNTVGGDFSSVKVAKGKRPDATGVALINNIFTGTISWQDSSGGLEYHNKENASQYLVNPAGGDYTLADESGCIDQGLILSGITPDKNLFPDLGAYEYGEDPWKAGHDFMNPPQITFKTKSIRFQNLVKNGSFDMGDEGSWSLEGNGVIDVEFDGSKSGWSDADGHVNNYQALYLMEGSSTAEQTISNLKIGKQYQLTAWYKVDSNVKGKITVMNPDGTIAVDQSVEYTSPKWRQVSCTFTAQQDTVVLCLSRTANSGLERAYFDDVYMAEVIPSYVTMQQEKPATIDLEWKFEGNGISTAGMAGRVVKGSFIDSMPGYGKCLSVYAVNSWVTIEHEQHLEFGDPNSEFTVAAWVRTMDGGSIVSKGRPGDRLSNIDYVFSVFEDGGLEFLRWNEKSRRAENISWGDPNVPLCDGEWHYVAFVNRADDEHSLYVDGEWVKTSKAVWIYNNANTEVVQIGRYRNAIYSENIFDGEIDNLLITKRALSESEIRAFMHKKN